MIEDAIMQAIPHIPYCEAAVSETRLCTCGAVGRRSVLYVQVTEHVQRLTRGRVYL